MADRVKPVLKSLFERNIDSLGDTLLSEPLYLQLSKFRKTEGGDKARLSDSQYSISVVVGNDADTSFCETQRIVKITQYYLGHLVMKNQDSRLYLRVEAWEDAGPATGFIGTPMNIHPDHVVGNLVHKTTPGDAPGDAPGAVSEPSRTASGSTNAPAKPNVNPKNSSASAEMRGKNKLITVESISPYNPNWYVLARVAKKSDIREFKSKNNDNPGKLFNLIITDETSDIKVTGFTNAVDAFYDKLVEGQQYYFSNFNVSFANKKFKTTNNDFEMIFRNDSKVELSSDTDRKLPAVFFNFVPSIASLADYEKDSLVDIAGVVKSFGDAQQITAKSSGIPYTKREVELIDDSEKTINVTFWGAEAEEFNGEVGTVLACKSAKLSSFNGLSLSLTRNSKVVMDADEKQVHKLKGWWNATNGSVSGTSIALEQSQDSHSQKRDLSKVTIAHVLERRLALTENDQPETYKIKARISAVYQRKIAYPACVSEGCSKKLIETSDGWKCEKCQTTVSEPEYRYIVSVGLTDVSMPQETLPVTVFDAVGRKLFGDRAKELQETAEETNNPGFNNVLGTAFRKYQGAEYVWILRVNVEIYEQEAKPRFTALQVYDVDPIKDGSETLAEMGL